MKFVCPLLAVSDLEASRRFYEELFHQKVVLDLGWNLTFNGGFAIQSNFHKIIPVEESSIVRRSHNMELYFEADDFDAFMDKLSKRGDIVYLHTPLKQDWQQRVVRIYDPDGHLIEIGESMRQIAQRYLAEGNSVEETAKIIQHPVEFVRSCL